MKAGGAVSLLSIAVVSILGAIYLAYGVVRLDTFVDYTTARMVLTNSGSIGVRSPVLLSGVRVGDVTSVDTTAAGVEVNFRIDDTYRIPVDSRVVIENLSAIGEPYIEFVPATGAGPYLRSGQTVATEKIRMPTSIPEVAQLVVKFLNQLDPESIKPLIETLDRALTGTESTVPGLARASDLLAASMISRSPQLGAVITNLQSLAGDMDWAAPAISAGNPQWVDFGVGVDRIAAAFGDLVKIAPGPRMYAEGNGLAPFLQQLAEWVRTVGPDLQALLPVLQPLVRTGISTIPQVDISSLLAQALASVGDDGALRLRINVK
ncbi:MlaD family protein [Nocardia sp. NPDC052001]|uniref:MlaD family protein n=1 Tax=Nocardia sp. NPDC052001 TaxID=3154853 RepID=UPI0034394937